MDGMEKPREVVILGAGGTGLLMADTVLRDPRTKLVGFLDDDANKKSAGQERFPVLGALSTWESLPPEYCFISSLYGPKKNIEFYFKIQSLGIPEDRWASVRDPSAVVSSSATLGRGVYVGPVTVVEPNVFLGNWCALLGGGYIGHDTSMDAYTACANSVSVAGGVRVGSAAFIGANATIREHVEIGRYALVGMGAVVIRDIPEGCIVVGNPSRMIGTTAGPESPQGNAASVDISTIQGWIQCSPRARIGRPSSYVHTKTSHGNCAVNGTRLAKLIPQIIAAFRLDLSGLTVLTEAASGAYVVTPIIAALAGAHRVIALTGESRYASVDAVITQTQELASLLGVPGAVEIHAKRSADLFAQADIITNLGFLRPIDAEAVEAMKPTAVVPLMCEAWEFRPGDIDMIACQRKGILVLGTDEHHPAVDVFPYSGWLALKLLLDAGIEIHRNRILVVSHDRFGVVIEENLRRAGIDSCLVQNLRDVPSSDLGTADALVICDYAREDCIVGPHGDMTPSDLATAAPAIRVIQFAGLIDVAGLQANGIFVYPGELVPARRMTRTLAALGPRPVVELHTAGLKIGEVAAHTRNSIADPMDIHAAVRSSCPFAEIVQGGNGDETHRGRMDVTE